ncbi:AAA family ATPase [Gloeothece verrucosa]|uniref:ATPase-like protein n=1 Tax=Gloeothece verrucosa (strain PCC 7822) TaxID=497965 RepID=E0UDW1_GLOV7|nr:ATP-binding protein [Gloeothece verrucosa]ADN16546.1 ATPase-like protein [Gloeothece verrucosa PCC 7822]
MLQSLKIENFRCFRSFELNNLGRINLLVGKNNSGKTSLLEAVQLFSSQFDLKSLAQLMSSRGEYLWENIKYSSDIIPVKTYEIEHLFYQHNLSAESQIKMMGIDNGSQGELKILFEENFEATNYTRTSRPEPISIDDISELELIIQWTEDNINSNVFKKFLVKKEKLILDQLRLEYKRIAKSKLAKIGVFIFPYSIDISTLNTLFDKIVLTSDEQLVINALKILEPTIERIASVRQNQENFRTGEKGGFLVKLSERQKPIPIGSMGDGIWRMLALVLAMVNVEGGILLVDEIDSGLHYTTMYDMWKIIWHTAKKLNIQVFATTHNSDCWTSLANLICDEKISEKDQEIRIHHIDKNKEASILFDESEIVIAAQRGIEIR